jgi:hypothetical protein
MTATMRGALADLEKQASEDRPARLPSRLPLSDIKMIPELFQPRTGKSEDHIEELARALREHRDLDPVLVMQVGRRPVLIDGHHRWSAYSRSKGHLTIPVKYFEGTVAEAIAESGRENSKAKLQMQSSDRQDYAWRLTKMAMYSKDETARAAGISKAQVAIMRKTLVRLGGQRASTYTVWIDAKRAAESMDGERGGVDEDWLHAQAQRHADRMYKTFGTKLSGNLGMLALTLEKYLGPERVEELVELLGSSAELHDTGDGPDQTRF